MVRPVCHRLPLEVERDVSLDLSGSLGRAVGWWCKKPLCERRGHVVKVGFDRLNYAKLKQLQQRDGKSLSELVYEFAVNGYIKEALPQDVGKDIRALASVANNLNQLAHEAHLVGYIDVHRENKALAQRIDRLLQTLAKEM